jgi:hypothetical protein
VISGMGLRFLEMAVDGGCNGGVVGDAAKRRWTMVWLMGRRDVRLEGR